MYNYVRTFVSALDDGGNVIVMEQIKRLLANQVVLVITKQGAEPEMIT